MGRIASLTALLLVAFCSLAVATIINVPGQYATIQAGINASVNGDTVLVAEGRYYERINFRGNNIFLTSYYLNDHNASHISNTIIDADTMHLGMADTGSVVRFVNRENSSATLQGFTISHGIGTGFLNYGRAGGGIYCFKSSPNIRYNIISRNRAYVGGGIYCDSSNATIINNTVAYNYGGWQGGAFAGRTSSPMLINNIFWHNVVPEVYAISGSPDPTISYSDIMGGYNGNGVIFQDPVFIDVYHGNLNLCSLSPCIDAGDPNILDPDGSRSDMGVYYAQHPVCSGEIFYVSTTGSDSTGNGSLSNPFKSIQHGIDVTNFSDTVLVQPGIYFENINFDGHSLVLASMYLLTNDTSYISLTEIDGRNGIGAVVSIPYYEDSITTVEGLTIANGNRGHVGGGISSIHSNPTISNNIIKNNATYASGGGILCMYSRSNIVNNTIYNGYALTAGGGIACLYSDVIIKYNKIDNSRGSEGGGIYCDRTNAIIDSNSITRNLTGGEGGAIYARNSECFFSNNDISNNLAYYHGGGILCRHSIANINNNTLVQNSGRQGGGGIYCSDDSEVNIIGNTIYGDSATLGAGIYCANSITSIRDNTIMSNISRVLTPYGGGQGGGIYSTQSRNEVSDNLISDNEGNGIYTIDDINDIISSNIISGNIGEDGGGIFSLNCFLTVSLNSISNNHAYWSGGGIYCGNCSGLINGNTIRGNSSTDGGGGIYVTDSNLPVRNNIIVYNNDRYQGGGIALIRSNAAITNITMVGNAIDSTQYGSGGGGIYIRDSNPRITGSILWADSAYAGHEIYVYSGAPDIWYNDIQGGFDGYGLGNINANPLFRNIAENDYHLMAVSCGDSIDSPCIDTGDYQLLDSLISCSWGLGTRNSDKGAYGGGDSLIVGINESNPEIPIKFLLSQNYPNPFNPTTTISYTLPKSALVSLEIYDILGRKVETLVNREEPAGPHQAIWNARDASSGIYFYRLQTDERTETKRMVLLR